MLLKKHIVLTSVTIGIALNSIIIYSIPNKQGQFYYWSYWSDNSYKLDIKTFDKYQIQTDVDTKKIHELVECEIKNKNRIDKWKFKVNYKSDRDTIIDFKHINSYKQKNCRLDFFEFTSFRVPSEASQYKELFDKEIRTFAIVSVSGKPERFIEGYGGMKEIIQELMVDFDYYNDYLTFRWENRNFWNNLANSYSDEIKKIEKLKPIANSHLALTFQSSFATKGNYKKKFYLRNNDLFKELAPSPNGKNLDVSLAKKNNTFN